MDREALRSRFSDAIRHYRGSLPLVIDHQDLRDHQLKLIVLGLGLLLGWVGLSGGSLDAIVAGMLLIGLGLGQLGSYWLLDLDPEGAI